MWVEPGVCFSTLLVKESLVHLKKKSFASSILKGRRKTAPKAANLSGGKVVLKSILVEHQPMFALYTE